MERPHRPQKWVGVEWLAPPFCPPRLPSPWPSPAERERGFVVAAVGVVGLEEEESDVVVCGLGVD